MAEGSTAWKAGAAADAVPPAPGGGCSRGQGKGEGGGRAPPPSFARQLNRWYRRAEVEEAGLCFLAWWVAVLCIVACLVWVRPYHNQPY